MSQVKANKTELRKLREMAEWLTLFGRQATGKAATAAHAAEELREIRRYFEDGGKDRPLLDTKNGVPPTAVDNPPAEPPAEAAPAEAPPKDDGKKGRKK
jgi:hypothetical protein